MFEERIKKLPDYALGFNTLLIGNAGCGKTTSLATLVKSGLEVFALFSEANGQTNFLKALREAGVTEEEMKRVHF
jgi:predicted AAA+ superfamily ATPase